jgi:hypothetical protein
MTSRGWSAVDQDHLDVGLGDQRVSEGKPARTRAHNQIIGVHEHLPAPSPISSSRFSQADVTVTAINWTALFA